MDVKEAFFTVCSRAIPLEKKYVSLYCLMEGDGKVLISTQRYVSEERASEAHDQIQQKVEKHTFDFRGAEEEWLLKHNYPIDSLCEMECCVILENFPGAFCHVESPIIPTDLN